MLFYHIEFDFPYTYLRTIEYIIIWHHLYDIEKNHTEMYDIYKTSISFLTCIETSLATHPHPHLIRKEEKRREDKRKVLKKM